LFTDVDGKVPLVEALIARDTATVKLLWENGATLKNADMGVYLGQAVLDNNKDLIDDYIKYGANINRVSDSEGLNALHIAVTEGRLEMVKFLVSRGADAHFMTSDDGIPSPCELAERYGRHPEIITFLKAQPIRDESYSADTPNETSNSAARTQLARRGSSTVEFQVKVVVPIFCSFTD
jgi:ankyrin repeat protein